MCSSTEGWGCMLALPADVRLQVEHAALVQQALS